MPSDESRGVQRRLLEHRYGYVQKTGPWKSTHDAMSNLEVKGTVWASVRKEEKACQVQCWIAESTVRSWETTLEKKQGWGARDGSGGGCLLESLLILESLWCSSGRSNRTTLAFRQSHWWSQRLELRHRNPCRIQGWDDRSQQSLEIDRENSSTTQDLGDTKLKRKVEGQVSYRWA